jgi:hypothetical protein
MDAVAGTGVAASCANGMVTCAVDSTVASNATAADVSAAQVSIGPTHVHPSASPGAHATTRRIDTDPVHIQRRRAIPDILGNGSVMSDQ